MPQRELIMNSATLAELKRKYLEEVAQEKASTHPADSPTSLLCPLSGTFMKNPVITPDGKVYEKNFIETSLQRKQEDPLTRNKLTTADLYPFKELLPHIQGFIEQQNKFLKIRKSVLQKAREIAHAEPAPTNPALFSCPISHAPIKSAVISAEGIIYDKNSLKNKKDAPNVVDFQEFQQFIKLYNSHRPSLTSELRRSEEPVQGTHQRLARFDNALQTLQTKIGQVDQHYLPEAFTKAKELLAALQKARDEYVLEVKKPSFNEPKAAEDFLKKCKEKITEVKPVLARDLGWDEYLSNLWTLVSTTFMSSFSSNPHGFYKTRSLAAVEKAEEDLGISPQLSGSSKKN
jgi:E3 ubiquitin-protein ligase LubX